MGKAVIEQLGGVVDGVNKIFATSVAFQPGSVVVFRNGQCRPQTATDGWTELSGTQIEMNEAPVPGDVISAWFRVAA